MAEFGSSDSGASLGDILGAAINRARGDQAGEGRKIARGARSVDGPDAARLAGSSYLPKPGQRRGMTKSELIQHLAERNPHLYQRDVERIVSTIFDEITAALSRGDRVELRGFGAFSVKRREARLGPQSAHRRQRQRRREAHPLLQDRQAAPRPAERERLSVPGAEAP